MECLPYKWGVLLKFCYYVSPQKRDSKLPKKYTFSTIHDPRIRSNKETMVSSTLPRCCRWIFSHPSCWHCVFIGSKPVSKKVFFFLRATKNWCQKDTFLSMFGIITYCIHLMVDFVWEDVGKCNIHWSCGYGNFNEFQKSFKGNCWILWLFVKCIILMSDRLCDFAQGARPEFDDTNFEVFCFLKLFKPRSFGFPNHDFLLSNSHFSSFWNPKYGRILIL